MHCTYVCSLLDDSTEPVGRGSSRSSEPRRWNTRPRVGARTGSIRMAGWASLPRPRVGHENKQQPAGRRAAGLARRASAKQSSICEYAASPCTCAPPAIIYGSIRPGCDMCGSILYCVVVHACISCAFVSRARCGWMRWSPSVRPRFRPPFLNLDEEGHAGGVVCL